MKTHEKHLLTEKITVFKKIKKLKKRFEMAQTVIDHRNAVHELVQFMKRHKDSYTDDIAKEINYLRKLSQKRVRAR